MIIIMGVAISSEFFVRAFVPFSLLRPLSVVARCVVVAAAPDHRAHARLGRIAAAWGVVRA